MFGSSIFDCNKDIPDLSQSVILITGGNSGLGKQSALELAKHNPSAIYITSRSPFKGQAALAEIKSVVPDAKIHLLHLDLASFTSIKNAVKIFLNTSSRLDILMNNGGCLAPPDAVTEDGYEIQFGTNHMGHALLTKLLLPTLLATSKMTTAVPRIVMLSSEGHSSGPIPTGGIKFGTLKTKANEIGRVTKYDQSKLANLLFAKELAHHYPGLMTVAVDPGAVSSTGLFKNWKEGTWYAAPILKMVEWTVAVSIENGAKNQLWAATSNDVVSGSYYVPIGKISNGSKDAQDPNLSAKLWHWTERELEGHTI